MNQAEPPTEPTFDEDSEATLEEQAEKAKEIADAEEASDKAEEEEEKAKINPYTGLFHKNGKRFFPGSDGLADQEVGGANDFIRRKR